MKTDELLSPEETDRLAALDDEQTIKELGTLSEEKSEEKEKTDQSQEEKEHEKEKGKEEKKEQDDSVKHKEAEEEEPDEYAKWNDNERGLYHAQKQARKRAQEAEKRAREFEINFEREKAAREASIKLMEKMRETKVEQKSESESVYKKARDKIGQKAIKYKEEYGEDYRPTLDEIEELDAARLYDFQQQESVRQKKLEAEQQHHAIRKFQEKADSDEKRFGAVLVEETGENDYEYVFRTFVQPQITQEIQSNGFSKTLYTITQSEKPAEAAYFSMLMTEQGRKYYSDKMKKSAGMKLNEDIIKDKNVTKTSIHFPGGKAGSSGKTKLTIEKYNQEFDKWYGKISEEQEMELLSGKDVWV